MSRVGVKPIEIPEGVEISFNGNTINVKGPKGELSKQLHPDIKVNMEDNVLTCERPSENTKYRSLHGTTRSLIYNMVTGVSQGFEKSLEINGVGYRAQKQGEKVVINAGYSHPVEIDPIEGIEIEIPKNTQIIVKGIDKEAVGAAAANIRAIRPPEPYKGKGIKYADEYLRSKEGKASK